MKLQKTLTKLHIKALAILIIALSFGPATAKAEATFYNDFSAYDSGGSSSYDNLYDVGGSSYYDNSYDGGSATYDNSYDGGYASYSNPYAGGSASYYNSPIGGSDSYYNGYTSPSYSSYSSPSYTPYSYSSGCSSCGGGYSYTPSQSYTYVPSSQSVASTNYNYVSNTNKASASNSNSITNNPVNIFEPTNNNDARINLVVLGGGSSQPTQKALDGACTISPNAAFTNEDVQFFANATGGNGSYTYSWSGDNGLSATAAAFTGKFIYPGMKTASVVITSNGQSITRTCSINVLDRGNQTVVSNSSTQVGNPVSGVFLNEVPETGIDISLKMTLFTVGILLWSLFAAYIINAKRSKSLALATNTDVASRIEAFKQRNLAKKI